MSIVLLSFLIAALVMLVATVRAHLSLNGLLLIAGLMLLSLSGYDWHLIALASFAFMLLMLVVPLRRTSVVIRAATLAVFSTSMALQSDGLATQLATVTGWHDATAIAITAAVVSLTSLCMAAANESAARLLPFACAGSVALPSAANSIALTWAFIGALPLIVQVLLRWRNVRHLERDPASGTRLAR